MATELTTQEELKLCELRLYELTKQEKIALVAQQYEEHHGIGLQIKAEKARKLFLRALLEFETWTSNKTS